MSPGLSLFDVETIGQAVLEKKEDLLRFLPQNEQTNSLKKSKIHWSMTIYTNLVGTHRRDIPTKFEVNLADNIWQEDENLNLYGPQPKFDLSVSLKVKSNNT